MKDYILSYKSMILQGNLQENIEIIWTQLYILMLLLCKIHLNRGNNMLNEQFYIISTYI